MVAYTFYELDGRVRRYAEALRGRGDRVDVIALRRDAQPRRGWINGVRVFRIQRRIPDERKKIRYLAKLLLFFVRSAFLLTTRHVALRYDIIHVHSVPDFEVFAATLPKLLSARVILDIHDIVPEFYKCQFHLTRDTLIYRALIFIEKLANRFSDHVIVSNQLWRERLIRRSARSKQCTAILNYPDTSLFFPRPRRRAGDKIIAIYPGTLISHQGVDIAVQAFALLGKDLPQAELHIYGEGKERVPLQCLVRKLGIERNVFIRDYQPIEKIAATMSDADIGIVPKRAEGFGGEAFSTKILEFMAVGIPVVASDTKVDRYYFTESEVVFFESGNPEALARVIIALSRDPEKRESLRRKGLEYIRNNNWQEKKELYFKIIDGLSMKRRVRDVCALRDKGAEKSLQGVRPKDLWESD